MNLLCASDDFVQRTLSRVPGAWGKLRYIAALRSENGEYSHWGMARTYGPAAARDAIADAHRAVLLEVLRTPVRKLLEDACNSAAGLQRPLGEFLQEMAGNAPALLPSNMGPVSARHFSSVLQALSSLARVGKAANRPAS